MKNAEPKARANRKSATVQDEARAPRGPYDELRNVPGTWKDSVLYLVSRCSRRATFALGVVAALAFLAAMVLRSENIEAGGKIGCAVAIGLMMVVVYVATPAAGKELYAENPEENADAASQPGDGRKRS